MTNVRKAPAVAVERFALAAARDRWLDFLTLEHATLPAPIDFAREGEELLVTRSLKSGRGILGGRIVREHAPLLFLQAAGLCSFLQAFGFSLAEEDLREAVFDVSDSGPRLWLNRTPRSVSHSGPGPAPSTVLAALLHRLFAHGRRIPDPSARSLFDRLLANDALHRRADFWLATTFRTFRDLGGPAAAASRARTIGFAGSLFRSPAERALLARAKALLEGRTARVFAPGDSALTPGGALGLTPLPNGVAAAARQLRLACEEEGRRPVWITVERDRWDPLSRQAFETVSRDMAHNLGIVDISSPVALLPRLPDEWRREVFVPCGTLSASLRFYERFAELTRPDPAAGRSLAAALTESRHWAAFVADPTGDGRLPSLPTTPADSEPDGELSSVERDVLEALSVYGRAAATSLGRIVPGRSITRVLERLAARGEAARDRHEGWRITAAGQARIQTTPARARAWNLRWAAIETDPGRHIELLLEGSAVEEALAAAERWMGEGAAASAERWFGLSARLASAAAGRCPAWLERLEAEREVAGGRLEEARSRLLALAAATSPQDVRRGARLRALEILVLQGDRGAAAREATAWRADHPEAPPGERVRALRVEAVHRSRQGDCESALSLLEQAERLGVAEDFEDRLETALTRAAVYSRAGRFREEQAVYESWRASVLSRSDDRLTARLLAHEALGLSDRREFPASIARLEEALAVARDDTAARAHLCLDLAVALYHGGRAHECGPVLEEAERLATASGRGDLARAARINRLELSIHQADWESAGRDIEGLLADADESKDGTTRLIALHQKSRLALRRGMLDAARQDNAEARALCLSLQERLEIGELWLEEGDRSLFAGDLEGARAAWEKASADLPDRCDTELQARERLRDLARRDHGRPAEEAVAAVAPGLARGDYSAAERVARWRVLFGPEGVAAETAARSQEILRARGGEALADLVFGAGTGPTALPMASLRALRDAVAAALTGTDVRAPLAGLGLRGLTVRDASGQEILRLTSGGQEPVGPSAPAARILRAGECAYELALWPSPTPDLGEALAFLLETMLYRPRPAQAPEEFARGWKHFQVITADPSMEEPYRRLVRFAPQPVTVLILGESGSGKEAVARAVHQLSPRSAGPFVAVNVPAIPAALLESELFGHARGAFTGADRDRRGLLEEASGGTIFFDEVGDLSLPLQAKLLRALQEREIRRLGENRSRAVDLRVVSATSRPLAAEVERGAFREDLYYRLHVAVITLPSLRERGRDVLVLARNFLERYAREYGRGDLQFSPEALTALARHAWPGNVRELQNAVSQAVALADSGASVGVDLLPETVRRESRTGAPRMGYRSKVNAHRRGLVSEALERAGGNRTRAARDLGLSRQALLYLIRELNVPQRPRSGH
jgi:two-component system, NtrC family, response regulator AtoC